MGGQPESDLRKKIFEIVSDHTKSEVSGEKNFINDLGFDSLDMVEVIIETENQFNIEISEDEGHSIATVNDLCAFVETKKNAVNG